MQILNLSPPHANFNWLGLGEFPLSSKNFYTPWDRVRLISENARNIWIELIYWLVPFRLILIWFVMRNQNFLETGRTLFSLASTNLSKIVNFLKHYDKYIDFNHFEKIQYIHRKTGRVDINACQKRVFLLNHTRNSSWEKASY